MLRNKKNWIIGIFSIMLLVILFFPLDWVEAGLEPGSQGDPLVSKSYVDRRVNEILSMIQGKTTPSNPDSETNKPSLPMSKDELLEQVDLLIQFRIKEAGIKAPTYEVIEVKKGQTIIGEQGTEMILRSGRAKAIASESGGLQNITAGTDIKQQETIPQYHLLLIPRSDGRGFEMDADGWIMIRGDYRIQ